MGVRMLHLADLHLDSAYGGRRETRSRLRRATLTAFANAVRFAIDERLDAVVIAGDAFDDQNLGYDSRAQYRQGLTRLVRAGIEVVYVTGNHDPGAPGSSASQLGLGERAARASDPLASIKMATDGTPKTWTLDRDGAPIATVVAAGHATARVTDDLASQFRRPAEADLPAIAVLHTQVSSARGADGHAPYAPSDPNTLASSDFDYWALGHVHVRGQATPDVPAWYAGNIQGRNARESGPKGGLLVEFDGRQLARRPTFVPFAEIEFMTVRVQSPRVRAHSPEDVAACAAEALEERLDQRSEPAPNGGIILRISWEAPWPASLARETRDRSALEALEVAIASEIEPLVGAVEILEVELRVNAGAARDTSAGTHIEDGALDELLSTPSALREALEFARAIELSADAADELDIPWSRSASAADDADAQLERRTLVSKLSTGLDEELITRALRGEDA